MKKIVFILAMVLIALVSNAQTLIEPDRGTETLVGGYELRSKPYYKGTMFLNCDIENNYYLSIRAKHKTKDDHITKYNFKDYEINDQIKTGKYIYIKLDNDSVMTLQCMSYYFKYGPSNLEQYGRGVEWICTTFISSNFKLNLNDVYALKRHNIIKMRLEFDKEYVDIVNDNKTAFFKTNEDFSKVFETLDNIYNTYIENNKKQIQSENRQKMINNDPLYDF